MAEKYYWLKLKRDFFKRHDIRIIESMPNGKDYILFYLKLLCESIDHDGNLRFSEQIPYNEDMLATITNTNVDIVRVAIKIFSELGMMEILDDGTYFMNEVNRMIGSETAWAEKKRIYRQSIEDKSRTKKDNVRQEIEKEIDIDIDIYMPEKVTKIVKYLNSKTNSAYRTSTKKTRDLIKARLNEGFTVEDFIKVIDNKSAEWLNTEMQKYLRPETLFGTKFESYLNQKLEKKGKFKNFDEREQDWDAIDQLYNQ